MIRLRNQLRAMSQLNDEDEEYLAGADVWPGYLYNKNTKEYFPRNYGLEFRTRKCPVQYKVKPFSMLLFKDMIKQAGENKFQWMKDVEAEDPIDALFIEGVKILKKRAVDIPKHSIHHTVTSILLKRKICMLLTFSQKVHVPWIEELIVYINATLNESSGANFPLLLLKTSRDTFIYNKENEIEPGIKKPTTKHTVDEFCRMLKNSDVNTKPISCYLSEPCASREEAHKTTNEDCEGYLEFILDESTPSNKPISCSPAMPGSSHVEAQRTACINYRNGIFDENSPRNICDNMTRESIHGKNTVATEPRNNCDETIRAGHANLSNKIEGKHLLFKSNKNKFRNGHKERESTELRSNDRSSEETHKSDIKTQDEITTLTNKAQKVENFSCSEETHKSDIETQDEIMHLTSKSQQVETDSCLGETHKSDIETQDEIMHLTSKSQQVETDSCLGETHKPNIDNQDGSMIFTSKAQQVENVETHKSNTETQLLKHDQTYLNLLNPIKTINDPCGIERKYYGEINQNLPEKVIILLGASGCGKTTLLNFIANYCMGKSIVNEKLVHVETTGSPTRVISAYTFCAAMDEYSLTIVDTPGLDDSSGTEIRDHVQFLKIFLANASSKGFEIHAIGFVAQAHLVRLTSSERIVMDYVSIMFGECVADHLITLVTFGDNQDNPPVIEAMKNYGIDFKQYFRFNNSALSSRNSDEVDDLDKAYWKIGFKHWRKCLKILKNFAPMSAKAMRNVQTELYFATIIESSEKNLNAELCTFLKECHKGNGIFNVMAEVGEQIWQQVAALKSLKSGKESSSCTLEHMLIKYALEACKALSLPPKELVYYLSLTSSGRLASVGSEIILDLEPIYKHSRNLIPKSELVSKNIFEWAYCSQCESEHELKRVTKTGVTKVFARVYESPKSKSLISLECEVCQCPGSAHGVSKVKFPLCGSEILKHAKKRLNEILIKYSLPDYPVSEENYSKFLAQHLGPYYTEFINDVFNVEDKL